MTESLHIDNQHGSNYESKFYDDDGNFTPIFHIKNNEFLVCMPSVGIGRPQSDVEVLVGRDGLFLTVYENLDTGKAYRQIPENWDENNNKRFLEVYGPIGLTGYRFDRWMDEKINMQYTEE